MSEQKPGLSIVQKGLLAAILPILFQFMLIANLSFLLRQAELDNRLARISSTMYQQEHSMLELLLLSEASLSRFIKNGNEPDAKNFEQFKEKLNSLLTQAQSEWIAPGSGKLTNNTLALAEEFDAHKKLIRDHFFKLTALMAESRANRNSAAARIENGDLTNEIVLFTSFLQAQLSESEKKFVEVQKSEIQSRREMNMYIIAAVALNLVIAVVIAAIFIMGLCRRLVMLNDNIERFSDGMPIPEPRLGKDEIGKLDSAFHQLARRVQEANQLKNEFVSMVTHDLKTPLTSIHLFHQLLRNNAFGALPDNAQVPLQSAERSAERLLNLVNSLLDIEKLSEGKLKLRYSPTRVSVIVSKSLESVATYASERQISILTQSGFDAEIMADEERLVQVLVNLLSNAIKFSPQNSSIKIGTHRDGDFVEVDVLDEGAGIQQDQQAVIFERYKQIGNQKDSEDQGSGLGLAICRAIIQEHKGQIGVESKPGNGSRFWFRLPAPENVLEISQLTQMETSNTQTNL